MTFEPIEHEPDDYSESAETSAGKAAGRLPITAQGVYEGNGSNDELWPILAGFGAVTDPSDIHDSHLYTVLINWRNASSKYVADQYHELRAAHVAATERAVKAEAALAELRQPANVEQLAEVSNLHDAYVSRHDHMNGFACCSAHAVADAAPMLLREIQQLGRELKRCADLNRELVNESAQCQAQLAETSADGAQWQSRAETAERELAELRERIGEAPEGWGVRWYDLPNQVTQLSEQAARKTAAADLSATLMRYVDGEWQEVPDGR